MANLDSFLGGYSAGNQMAEQGRQQRNRAAIQSLAPQIIGGDPQAFSKAASLDPQAATGLQQSGEGMVRRARGAAQYLQKALQGGNPMEISAARRTIKPYMDTLRPGQQYPMDMDPAQEAAGIQSFLAETQMYDPSYSMQGGNGVQSTYVDSDGNRIAIMRNGTTQVLGRNDAGSNQQTLNVDINGVPTQVTFDRRTGGYTNANIGGQQAQQQIPQQSDMEADIALANQMIAANIPAEQVDAFLAQRGQRAQNMAPQAGIPIVGRTKEAEAAAVERAKAGAQIENLSTELGMRTDAALREAEAKAGIERASKRQATQDENNRTFNMYESAMAGVIEGLGGSNTGPLIGRLPAVTSNQQVAEGAVSAIAPVLKQLFRAAGEGSFTDKDQELLMAMIPTRTDTPAARNWKIRNIDAIIRQKLGQPEIGGQSSAPTPYQRGGQSRSVVRTGQLNGRRVVQYSDGSTEYAD